MERTKRSVVVRSIWTELMALEFSQTYIDVDGVRTRCLVAGAGEPLVMLHSGGGFAEAYARNIAAHARHFRVFVPDLLGCGLTERPDRSYCLDDYVVFLEAFRNVIGATRMLLSGCSVGAWIAAMYAAAHPDRVSKLVLNCGVPLRPDANGAQEFVDRDRAERAATTENELRAATRHTFLELFRDSEDRKSVV